MQCLGRRLLIGAGLVLVSALAVWPHWVLGVLPHSHEGARYTVVAELFRQALAAGIPYPRWLPDLQGGYGYPLFVFYQPAYFYLSSAFGAALDDVSLRQLATLTTIALAGSAGAYLLARRFLGTLRALLAAGLFQSVPYANLNLDVRGDLSEWLLLQLVPWCLYGLQALVTPAAGSRAGAWCALVAATTLGCYAHPMGVIFLPLLLAAMALAGLSRPAPRDRAWARSAALDVALALTVALALSSPYWLPVASMKGDVRVEVALQGGFEAARNPLPWAALLLPSQASPLAGQPPIGLPFALVALAGAAAGRRQRAVSGAAAALAASLVLMTAVGSPFWRLPPFSLMQFPWRLAVFAPALVMLCAVGGLIADDAATPAARWRQRLLIGLALVAIVAAQALRPPHTPLSVGEGTDRQRLDCLAMLPAIARPGSFAATFELGEWTPRTPGGGLPATPRGRPPPEPCAGHLPAVRRYLQQLAPAETLPPPQPTPTMTVEAPGWQGTRLADDRPHAPAFRFVGSDSTAEVTIEQLYLPGWKVLLDGRAVARDVLERQRLPDGRMRLRLEPGEHVVRARYAGPPHAGARHAAILAACGLIAIVVWRRRRAPAPESPG